MIFIQNYTISHSLVEQTVQSVLSSLADIVDILIANELEMWLLTYKRSWGLWVSTTNRQVFFSHTPAICRCLVICIRFLSVNTVNKTMVRGAGKMGGGDWFLWAKPGRKRFTERLTALTEGSTYILRWRETYRVEGFLSSEITKTTTCLSYHLYKWRTTLIHQHFPHDICSTHRLSETKQPCHRRLLGESCLLPLRRTPSVTRPANCMLLKDVAPLLFGGDIDA